MTNIYDQHISAFKNVSAYVILKDGKRVATVAFKYPKDGAGRLYAYVHWIGTEMARGFANGYGYDKHSAAVESAVERIEHVHDPEAHAKDWIRLDDEKTNAEIDAFKAILKDCGGSYWDIKLENAGFSVLRAV